MGIFEKPVRPAVRLPLTPAEAGIELLALAAILLNILLEVLFWPQLPDQVSLGAVAMGNTKMIFLFLTIVAAVVYGGTTLLGLFPRHFNYPVPITAENAPRQYRNAANMMRSVKLVVMLGMLYAEWSFIQAGLGNAWSMSPAFIPALLIVLGITMGYFFFQMFRLR
jgi:hypothetical protein